MERSLYLEVIKPIELQPQLVKSKEKPKVKDKPYSLRDQESPYRLVRKWGWVKERPMDLGMVDANIFELIYVKKKARIDITSLYEINGLINIINDGLEDDEEED